MERAMGIEPTSKAWEAFILPMNYARMMKRFRFIRYCKIIARFCRFGNTAGNNISGTAGRFIRRRPERISFKILLTPGTA